MNFDEYQKEAKKTAVYPGWSARQYLMMGIVSEVGELAALIKRELRDGEVPDETEVISELGDILWYLSQLCTELGLDLDAVAGENLAKLARRTKLGTLKGKGGDR